MNSADFQLRPALAPGVRLQNDPITSEPVLLFPEGVLILNPTAHEIVSRCDGAITIEQLIAACAEEYEVTRAQLAHDITACLEDLRARQLIVLFAMNERPYALLAEVTYRCPLHCPYCSNPVQSPRGEELTTLEWQRVIREAAALGILHVGFSGGEPLARRDLTALVAEARAAGLYTNLITSGMGLDSIRARELREAGLDSLQLSFQADEPQLADRIAGTPSHRRKLTAASLARDAGLPLSMNVVLHRANIDRLAQIVALAEQVGAVRLELANTQYYGWALRNRAHLLPTREQVRAASETAREAKERLRDRMEIFYVVPDYYEDRPKPCLQGWGRRYLTVNPIGDVLPCPTAFSIPGLRFENVRAQPLSWIWRESASFNQFRGTAWMREPCASCPRREIDFGGCRCQAALLLGEAAATDPVCTLSPDRRIIDHILAELPPDAPAQWPWEPRRNPARTSLEGVNEQP